MENGGRIEPHFFILFSELGVDPIFLYFQDWYLSLVFSLMLKAIVFPGIQLWVVEETCKTGKLIQNQELEAGVMENGGRIEPHFFILFSELGVDPIFLYFQDWYLSLVFSLMLKAIVFPGIQLWVVEETCKTGKLIQNQEFEP